MKRISIFGVTGSIGANTVSVVESIGVEHFKTVAVSGNANITGLVEAAKRLNAEIAITADANRLEDLRTALAGSGIEAAKLSREDCCDVVPVEVVGRWGASKPCDAACPSSFKSAVSMVETA